MTPQEGQHLLYLVAVLRRATENVIVPASLVVHGLHRLTSRPEFRLEIARHLDVRDCDSAVSGTVCRAVQYQDRCPDLNGKVTWIASGVGRASCRERV